jgi:hypothetical protein
LLNEQLESEHQQKLTAIAKREQDQRTRDEESTNAKIRRDKQQSLDAITSGLELFASKNKKAAKLAFNLNKGKAIAEAAQNTYLAATKALTLGPILGPIAAVAIAALGFRQISAIAQTRFNESGSGGTPGAVGGGGGNISAGNFDAGTEGVTQNAAIANAADLAPKERTTINVVGRPGDTVTVEQMNDILDKIKDASANDEITITVTEDRAVIA